MEIGQFASCFETASLAKGCMVIGKKLGSHAYLVIRVFEGVRM
jgi:hypothetical protein